MTDIVERLRTLNADFLHEEAADEIERLRSALREARKGLMYWGPITGGGFSEKARITNIVDAALSGGSNA